MYIYPLAMKVIGFVHAFFICQAVYERIPLTRLKSMGQLTTGRAHDPEHWSTFRGASVVVAIAVGYPLHLVGIDDNFRVLSY